MIKFNRRGSVLIHVLVTGVLVAFIAAGLLRMVLMNYIAVERASKGAQNRKEAEAMLNRALTYWNANQVCTDIPNTGPPANGIDCGGAIAGQCACTCYGVLVLGPAAPKIVVTFVAPATLTAGPCNIDITSSDPP